MMCSNALRMLVFKSLVFAKDQVHQTKVTDLQDLYILDALEYAIEEVLGRARREIEYRLDVVHATRGARQTCMSEQTIYLHDLSCRMLTCCYYTHWPMN